MAVAQYCGTSVQMIQEDYCAPLELGNRDNPATEINASSIRATGHSTDVATELRKTVARYGCGAGI